MLEILAQADRSLHDTDWRFIVREVVIRAVDILVLFMMVTIIGANKKEGKGEKQQITLGTMALVYIAAVVGMAVVEKFVGPHIGDLTMIAVAAVPAVLMVVCLGVGPGPAGILMLAFLGYREVLKVVIARMGW
jgi:hypothetical protein